MNAPEMMLILVLLRLVIPFGMLLWVGETVQRRRIVHSHRM
jgi:hypothetical protein